MRVVVASAPLARLSSAHTGAALARAWAELGVSVAVVPMAQAGAGFGEAWADLTGAAPVPGIAGAWAGEAGAAGSPVDERGRSADGSGWLGEWLRSLLAAVRPERGRRFHVWLEVAQHGWSDGGTGFWDVVTTDGDTFADIHLQLVVPQDQLGLHLTGFRGITAVRGRSDGMHPGDMLAADQRLVDWCASIGRPELGTTEGSGAAGGLGACALALGGDVVGGAAECARLAGLAGTVQQADLVVTGCDELEFGTKGGEVVALACDLAGSAGRPVVALARHNWISSRELRTMGIEQAFSLEPTWPASEDAVGLDAAALTERAGAAARAWSW